MIRSRDRVAPSLVGLPAGGHSAACDPGGRAVHPPRRILLAVRHPVGGIRTFLRDTYARLDAQRYQLTLVCPDLPEAQVLVREMQAARPQYVPLAPRAGAAALAQAVTALLWRERFDLVHSQGFTASLCAAPAARARGVPHLVTCHDLLHATQFEGAAGVLRQAGLTLALSIADGIHCVSHDGRDNLIERLARLGSRRDRIVVIPNGIDTRRFLSSRPRDLRAELGLPADTYLIGFFGRFMSQKGFGFLVDALARLCALGPLAGRRPHLLAYGGHDGFYREEQENVRTRGLAESVTFLPFQPDIAPVLKGLDVAVMPSVWEACGLVAMEAMVAGVPLVGTSCLGLREVLHGGPARVVPPRSGAALAEALALEMVGSSRVSAARYAPVAAARFDVAGRAAELEAEMLRHMARRSART